MEREIGIARWEVLFAVVLSDGVVWLAADFWRLPWLIWFKTQAANTIKLSSGFSSQSGPAVCRLQFMYHSRKAFYSPLRKRLLYFTML